MSPEHVLVKCDVYCDWKDKPPVYRLFVGNELFVERTYIWQEQYLEELIPVYAEPGEYHIRYELVPPSQGTLVIKNQRVSSGPGTIANNILKVITNESP
jgi:hypothetical protein